jgi:hypothetical protein
MIARIPLVLLVNAAIASSPIAAIAQISVGANVHVSSARPNDGQSELMAAADPRRANRLITCSVIFSAMRNESGVVVYLSDDGGRSWKLTFETYPLMDPACAFSDDGNAYLLAFSPRDMRVYRSGDGGEQWGQPTIMNIMDRPYLTLDQTRGKNHGRLYIHGAIGGGTGDFMDGSRDLAGIKLYSSGDSARTLSEPVQRAVVDKRSALGTGNGVVLSDGTLVILWGELQDYWNPDGTSEMKDSRYGVANAKLRIVTSRDGGRRLTEATTVADYYMHIYPWRPPAGVIPWIAVDATTGAFKDRLYVVWPDRRSGRDEILFSRSSDRGKTWSKPVVINDDPMPRELGNGPDHFNPVVAVNKNGVVGVVWNDRREARDNLGWDIRFTASLDGGDTWLPNVKVSQKSNDFGAQTKWPVTSFGFGAPGTVSLVLSWMPIYGGDTGGLTADANGLFHAVWSDNRTGSSQLWTSAIAVAGVATPNGSAELAGLDDYTTSTRLLLTNASYDRASRTLTATARLVNDGKDTLRGPVSVRVLAVRSPLGSARIRNADNQLEGVGALWHLTPLLSGGQLLPGDTTGARELRFEVNGDLVPIRPNAAARLGVTNPVEKFQLIELDTKVLAARRAK